MTDFGGRPVLVTGASGGIGAEIVRQLVAADADVVAAGRSEEALAPVAAETGARTAVFDLTSEEEIAAALSDLDLWGVVNCGGFGGEIASPMDTDISVFDKVMAINARGALLVTKYAARTMVRLGQGGSIVNVSARRLWSRWRTTSPTARLRPRWTTSPVSARSSWASTAYASTASTRRSS